MKTKLFILDRNNGVYKLLQLGYFFIHLDILIKIWLLKGTLTMPGYSYSANPQISCDSSSDAKMKLCGKWCLLAL